MEAVTTSIIAQKTGQALLYVNFFACTSSCMVIYFDYLLYTMLETRNLTFTTIQTIEHSKMYHKFANALPV